MLYTKEIFDILSRGGFLSQNSVNQQRSRIYDEIEDHYEEYQQYFQGIGFLLEGGNGYFYFTRPEPRVELYDKLQRLSLWIDRVDFLKVFNPAFGPGFTFRKSNILEQFANDVELKEKSADLYPETGKLEDKIDKLISDLDKQGYIEIENDIDGTFRVTMAFHYIEEMIDCITIFEPEEETR